MEEEEVFEFGSVRKGGMERIHPLFWESDSKRFPHVGFCYPIFHGDNEIVRENTWRFFLKILDGDPDGGNCLSEGESGGEIL